MATILDNVRTFFNGKSEQVPPPESTPPITSASPESVAMNHVAPVAANDDAEFSLTVAASDALTRLLRSQTLMRFGHEKPALYPVEKVELINGFGHGGSFIARIDEANAVEHGQNVTLQVTLNKPANDYDIVALKNALPTLLEAIPTFKGKLKAKEAHVTPPTYADVAKELEAVLATKPHGLTAASHDVVKQFFDAHRGESDRQNFWNNSVSASHHEGVVSVTINACELPKDKDAVVSTDATIVDYFKAHQAQVMQDFKERMLKLKVDGVTAETLAHLDMHVAAQGWNIEAKFGTKPVKHTDEAGKELTGEAYAKAMGETALAKIDTKVIEKAFTESLLHVNMHELNPVMVHILDGPMLGHYLKTRFAGDAEMTAFLDRHDIFKNEADTQAEKAKAVQDHKIVLGDASVGKTPDGKADQVSVDFELPPKMKLQEVLAAIVAAKAQMSIDLQRTANENKVGAEVARVA